jgi:hypothetical protein
LVRFIENHDEPRAACTFSPAEERAATVTMATLPGARLFHEGQFEGRKVRPPVFMGRRPYEPVDEDLKVFCTQLLHAIDSPVFRDGEWTLCEKSGWPDNPTFLNLVAWNWIKREERYLVIVNLSGTPAQALVRVPWSDVSGTNWRLSDRLSDESYERSGDQMGGEGLYVELAPWNFHFFRCERISV